VQNQTVQTEILAKIEKIHLDSSTLSALNYEVIQERNAAIHDLLEDNYFAPVGLKGGSYHVQISMNHGKLIFDIQSAVTNEKIVFILSMSPFMNILRDYFTICESYYSAIKKSGSLTQIETIDMARRGLHNEGADILKERLKDKIICNDDTARRLFTLICALHLDNMG
jgi:uncharacterized protein (UPF0262 family)